MHENKIDVTLNENKTGPVYEMPLDFIRNVTSEVTLSSILINSVVICECGISLTENDISFLGKPRGSEYRLNLRSSIHLGILSCT